jgi:hypothetical protein
MNIALQALGLFVEAGKLVVRLIGEQPDSEALKTEALARMDEMQKLLQGHDKFAEELQAGLDKAVPRVD